MKSKAVFPSFIIGFLLLAACGSAPQQASAPTTVLEPVAVVIPDQLVNRQCNTLENLQNSDMKVVYYFDGDCAFCFGRLRALETIVKEELGDVTLINIASTNNYTMFKHYLSQSMVQSCVLVDTTDSFFHANDEFLLNQIGLVDGNGDRVYVGDLLEDEEAKEEYKRLLGM